jgi:hypothetical protein
VFGDMVYGVGRGQDFGLINVVYAESFEDLRWGLDAVEGGWEEGMYLAFDEVTNSCLCHDRDSDCLHDLFDHLGVAHAGYATLRSDVGRDALKGHNGSGTGLFCYTCLGPSVKCLQYWKL